MFLDGTRRIRGFSTGSEIGAITRESASLAMAEVVALQTGQECEEAGAALKSAQE
jgi:putative N-acetylmannosamine-6-phosphate epimerase